mmetsp:Transcript_11289/g.30240  ORF Transcript_11289/g.30240 Transcript_11289/m.30240 type:complete len:264 (+) Transcript_11289:127-918(+)
MERDSAASAFLSMTASSPGMPTSSKVRHFTASSFNSARMDSRASLASLETSPRSCLILMVPSARLERRWLQASMDSRAMPSAASAFRLTSFSSPRHRSVASDKCLECAPTWLCKASTTSESCEEKRATSELAKCSALSVVSRADERRVSASSALASLSRATITTSQSWSLLLNLSTNFSFRISSLTFEAAWSAWRLASAKASKRRESKRLTKWTSRIEQVSIAVVVSLLVRSSTSRMAAMTTSTLAWSNMKLPHLSSCTFRRS